MVPAVMRTARPLFFAAPLMWVLAPGQEVPAGPARADASAPAADRPAARASAIGQVTGRIAADLGAGGKEAWVFLGPLRTDEPAPRAPELVARLAFLIAAGIGGVAHAEPVAASTAHAIAHKAKSLVYAQVEIANGQLRVIADLYRPTRNMWDRARQPAPAPVGHGFASARLDGEVRAYLAPVPLSLGRIDRIATEDRDILALACGDADDDGSLEIVTLGRRRAAMGRARGGRFVPSKTALLRDLSGVAAAPLREPVGGIAIVPRRADHGTYIDVGITDRARGSRLDQDLRPLGTIAGVPFATSSGDACVTFQGTTLTSAWAKCADTDLLSLPTIEPPFDAIAFATVVAPDGVARMVAAARDPRTAEVHLWVEANTATIPSAGAQLAVSDLDQDGTPEIISTLDVPPKPASGPAEGALDDALVITSWFADGTLRERGRTPVPAGVRALATCPPDGAGPVPIVLATPGELWIVR
jgi:hypothetical protein